jgi:hypothetical protein
MMSDSVSAVLMERLSHQQLSKPTMNSIMSFRRLAEMAAHRAAHADKAAPAEQPAPAKEPVSGHAMKKRQPLAS